MVGHHVAQGAGAVIEGATAFHADGLGCGDLYVIDVMIVPERFEDTVGEAADEDVLHRLLAQVVIDTVDLLFAHDLEQAGVERLGAGQVRAEGFFHHHPAKACAFIEQPGCAQALDDLAEKAWRGSQIKHRIGAGVLLDAPGNGLIGGVVEEVTGLVTDALGQPAPVLFIQAVGALAGFVALTHEGFQACGELGVAGGVVVHPDDTQVFIQQPVAAQVVKGRHQQALDQIAIGAEQKQGARWRSFDRSMAHSAFFST
ncbi:hypothetical protein D3C81_759840 [compost metagenome]